MDLGLILAIVIGLILLTIVVILLLIYNGLVRLKNNIKKAWANIDVLLKQRSDELPNLIECVKGYMEHERSTLEAITKARTEVLQASTLSKKAASDSVITESLKTLFAVAEKYPNLKANENFLKLQTRITSLENELADRREFYNDSVTIYNTRIHSIPDMIVARMMKSTDEQLFSASEEDKALVQVSIGK
ncbi:MAG: LemA family protein [Candidatus Thermoplasmatota archaeon]|nr:LemA family protein [Candidatus Thermoplasmatota archaeon]